MSARSLRLRLRDASAGTAFVAMALGGQLPPWAVGVFGVALVVALAGRRPLSRRPTATALLLLGVAVALATSVVSLGLDPVVAASTFAGLVAAQRMLSEPAPATDGHVHLAGVLMLAGGAALTGDLPFVLCVVAFAFCSSLSMGLGVVEAAVPPGEPVPVRQVLRPLSLGVVGALVGAAVFFVAFPRMQWQVLSRRASPGLGQATTGFSDRVRLGSGEGTLKSNPRIVLRARLDPDPGDDQLGAYWLGRTYSTFDGREWADVPREARPEVVVTLRRSDTLPQREARLRYQRIELLPAYGARTAIALEPPVRFTSAVVRNSGGAQRTGLLWQGRDEVRFADEGVSYIYEAYSLPDGRDPGAEARLTDAERAALLALPPGLDPRVGELAARVAGTERDPLRVAQRLADHLQREYAYTLELSGEVADPLFHFLFERKAGHCEHFATALAVLLRTRGIPARVATGFNGGERAGELYVVRAGDAHAWTQVLVPGRGFVTVDATPPAYRSAQGLPIVSRLLSLYEQLEEAWRTAVVDYSLRDQVEGMRWLLQPRGAQRGARGPAPALGRARWHWVLGGVGALAVAWALVRLAPRLLRRRRAPGPHTATRLWEQAEAALGRAGTRPRPGETPEELAARLAAEGHPLAPPVARLTRRYLEARFGGRPLASGEARALLAPLRVGPRPAPTPAPRPTGTQGR